MRVPLSWLREFVDVDLTPEQLAERLRAAIEAERIVGEDLERAPAELTRLLRQLDHG